MNCNFFRTRFKKPFAITWKMVLKKRFFFFYRNRLASCWCWVQLIANKVSDNISKYLKIMKSTRRAHGGCHSEKKTWPCSIRYREKKKNHIESDPMFRPPSGGMFSLHFDCRLSLLSFVFSKQIFTFSFNAAMCVRFAVWISAFTKSRNCFTTYLLCFALLISYCLDHTRTAYKL